MPASRERIVFITKELPEGMLDYAREKGLIVVGIICLNPREELAPVDADLSQGISFFACLHFLPRSGDRIVLEDGTQCEVRWSFYSMQRDGDERFPVLQPIVIAQRTNEIPETFKPTGEG